MAIHKGSLNWFKKQMHNKLVLNNHKIGWLGMSNRRLLHRIHDELAELSLALIKGNRDKIISECVDLANFAMFLADNAHRQEGDFKQGRRR